MSDKFVHQIWVKSLKWQNVFDELNMGFQRRRQTERMNGRKDWTWDSRHWTLTCLKWDSRRRWTQHVDWKKWEEQSLFWFLDRTLGYGLGDSILTFASSLVRSAFRDCLLSECIPAPRFHLWPCVPGLSGLWTQRPDNPGTQWELILIALWNGLYQVCCHFCISCSIFGFWLIVFSLCWSIRVYLWFDRV